MVMVVHLYSAFSMWIYSNALYNTLWGTLPGRADDVNNDDGRSEGGLSSPVRWL